MSNHPQPTFPPEYAKEDIGYITRNVSIAFIVLELVFVGLRYLAQHMAGEKSGVDDILMLPSLILCLGMDVSALGHTRNSYICQSVR